jgi:DNA-binding transcriptional regulator YiaG
MNLDENISAHKFGTVFDYRVKLRENALTTSGYFDLTQIEDLRIVDNGFLKLIRTKYKLKQKDLAQIASVPLRTEIGWESYKKAIPFANLLKIFNHVNIKEKDGYKLIRGCSFTFGKHHGKNRIILPLRPEEFYLSKYLSPIDPNKVYLFKNTPKNLIKKVIADFSIDKYYFNKTGLITIYSYLLHIFIDTFYKYEKELKLSFPLSREVIEWQKSGVNILKASIIPFLITDGGEKPACVFCSGESDIVHKIWADSVYYYFNGQLPSSFQLPYKRIFVTSHRLPKNILSKIKRFSPSFKTSPVDESHAEYNKLPQPDLSYLFKCSSLEQQIAIRIFAITEGSISVRNSKKEKLITPALRIACAHPKLLDQLKKVVELNGINCTKTKGYTTWSNLSGIRTTSIKSIIAFLKIGGFIRGVGVSKLKSPHFGGFDKQDVLLGILEFMVRQRKDATRYRITSIEKINKHIREIILNKQFKDEKYYINYFENVDRTPGQAIGG